MLIKSNPPPSDWTDKGEPYMTIDTSQKGICTNLPFAVKTTLVITPSNLIRQWADEVTKHFEVL
jgi:hypothetical protein